MLVWPWPGNPTAACDRSRAKLHACMVQTECVIKNTTLTQRATWTDPDSCSTLGADADAALEHNRTYSLRRELPGALNLCLEHTQLRPHHNHDHACASEPAIEAALCWFCAVGLHRGSFHHIRTLPRPSHLRVCRARRAPRGSPQRHLRHIDSTARQERAAPDESPDESYISE